MYFPPTLTYHLLIGVKSVFSSINVTQIFNSIFEFVATGKIPFTNLTIAYEPLAISVLLALWIIATYNFSYSCVTKITQLNLDEPYLSRQKYFDAISL